MVPIEIIYPDLKLKSDVAIYRYMSADAFIETVMTQKMRFTKVSSFTDKLEGRLSDVSRAHRKAIDEWLSVDSGINFVRQKSHFDLIETSIRDFNYSTSWTLKNPQTNPLWKKFGLKGKNSVALISSLKTLANALERDPLEAKIKCVTYIDHHNEPIKIFDDREIIYFKDKKFSWEQEVRFNLDLSHDRKRPKFFKVEHLPRYEYEPINLSSILGFYCHPSMDKNFKYELLKLHPFV